MRVFDAVPTDLLLALFDSLEDSRHILSHDLAMQLIEMDRAERNPMDSNEHPGSSVQLAAILKPNRQSL